MIKLPDEYKDLNNYIIHPIIREALKLYGTTEFQGEDNNPVILSWAKELNSTIRQYYTKDEIAWCALFMSIVSKRAGFEPPEGFNALRAKSFMEWGDTVKGDAVIGDILVFDRSGGGHVGIYAGEDKTTYHVLGGNQGDKVSIVRIPKDRLMANGIRRAPMNSCLKCAIRIFRTPKGALSLNER